MSQPPPHEHARLTHDLVSCNNAEILDGVERAQLLDDIAAAEQEID